MLDPFHFKVKKEISLLGSGNRVLSVENMYNLKFLHYRKPAGPAAWRDPWLWVGRLGIFILMETVALLISESPRLS